MDIIIITSSNQIMRFTNNGDAFYLTTSGLWLPSFMIPLPEWLKTFCKSKREAIGKLKDIEKVVKVEKTDYHKYRFHPVLDELGFKLVNEMSLKNIKLRHYGIFIGWLYKRGILKF